MLKVTVPIKLKVNKSCDIITRNHMETTGTSHAWHPSLSHTAYDVSYKFMVIR
jgi:hypothetical protein